jgi:hypothetical protein
VATTFVCLVHGDACTGLIYIFVLNPVSEYDSDSVFIHFHLTYGFVLSKPMQIEFTSLRKDEFRIFFLRLAKKKYTAVYIINERFAQAVVLCVRRVRVHGHR